MLLLAVLPDSPRSELCAHFRNRVSVQHASCLRKDGGLLYLDVFCVEVFQVARCVLQRLSIFRADRSGCEPGRKQPVNGGMQFGRTAGILLQPVDLLKAMSPCRPQTREERFLLILVVPLAADLEIMKRRFDG